MKILERIWAFILKGSTGTGWLYKIYLNRIKGTWLDDKLCSFKISKKAGGVPIIMSNPLYFLILPELKHKTSKFVINEGDVVIDAGAYPGEFTIYAAKKVGEEGKVIAFEPDPINFKRLKKNIDLNNLDNVILVNKGLWSGISSLDFVLRDLDSNLKTNDMAEEGEVVKVDTTALDKELESLGIENVDFIKMDIEGAEIEALEGMEKILKQHKPHLAIASYHIRNGEKTRWKVEEFLEEQGYDVETPEPPSYGELITFASKN